MGKDIIPQRRGRGGTVYRAPSFKFTAQSKIGRDGLYTVTDLLHCRAHSAPMMKLREMDGTTVCTVVAPEGIAVGSQIMIGGEAQIKIGNSLRLEDIPEGVTIYSIESAPGDGGKFVRSSGSFARVVAKMKDTVIVEMPSKKRKKFHPQCRAIIGIVAGGGRHEKPILKAGINWRKKRKTNKKYPVVSGSAMNAVAHPFGNARSSRKSKSKPISRDAPPGRKVGMVGARRTGRKRGKGVVNTK